jgi:hypothetical protein
MSYPSVLKYYLEKLDNVSRNTFLLYPQTPQTAYAGDTISITLPENSIVNLDAFTLYANLNTVAGSSPPRGVESLIDQITVLVNGIQVGPGSQMTNYLSTALIDWYGADKMAQRKVMQLGNNVTAPTDANTPAAATGQTAKPIAISHFLGFLSSAQPRYLDTSILGQVRLQIKLAGANVVPAYTGVTGSCYLDTIQALCQVVSIDDGSYSLIVQQRLSNGGVKIPFKYYLTFQGNNGTASQNLRMTVSSQSVDGVWATFQDGNTYNSKGTDTVLRNTKYFTRKGTDVVDSVFAVNGVRFPSIPLTPTQIWMENLHNMGLSADMVGAMDGSLDSLAEFKESGFLHYFKFNVDNDEGSSRLSSGLDTRGSASTLTWQTTGGGVDYLSTVFVECTALMNVGPNRTIDVTW